jgi:hypothetical protein
VVIRVHLVRKEQLGILVVRERPEVQVERVSRVKKELRVLPEIRVRQDFPDSPDLLDPKVCRDQLDSQAPRVQLVLQDKVDSQVIQDFQVRLETLDLQVY